MLLDFFRKLLPVERSGIINVSKVASSKASSIASEGKESIMVSSKKLNEKWNNLSPRDRKIISELIVAMIEIGLLKGFQPEVKKQHLRFCQVYPDIRLQAEKIWKS